MSNKRRKVCDGVPAEGMLEAVAKVRSKFPWVLDTLSEFQEELGGRGSFETERGYLKHIELCTMLRGMIAHATCALYDSTVRVDRRNDADDRVDLAERLASLMSLEARLSEYAHAADTSRARLARLCDLYGFSPVERRLFETLATFATAQTDAVRCTLIEEEHNRRANQLCRLAAASELEVEKFADADAQHVKENVVYVSDDAEAFVSPGGVPPLRLSKICAQVLVGERLNSDELLKCSGTKLETVLAQEGIVNDLEGNEALEEAEEEGEEDTDNNNNEHDSGSSSSQRPFPADNELEYLGETFDVIALRIRLATAKIKSAVKEQSGGEKSRSFFPPPDEGSRAGARELKAKIRVAEARLAARCAISPTPRLVKLARKLDLDKFETSVVVLLVGRTISPAIKALMDSMESSAVQRLDDSTTVGALLSIFCPDSFRDQVAHRARFYKGARLVSRGVVRVGRSRWHSSGSTDLTESRVELDRRVLDFCVGLDTEINELVEGSELYSPSFDFDDLVLPNDQKQMLIALCSAYEKLAPFVRQGSSRPPTLVGGDEDDSTNKDRRREREESPYGKLPAYGTGLIVLLTGPSGTGKTCTVHAVANRLGKRVLQVDFGSLKGKAAGGDDVDADLRGLFREAEMADAICLFDECEALFRSRDVSGGTDRLLRAMLQEIERYPGIVFLASNRPAELDEALHRRISTVIEYRPPNPKERKSIFLKLSKTMPTAKNIPWDAIALKYELSGGFIKNALLSSLLLAIHRCGEEMPVVITEADIRQACTLQQRGIMHKHGTGLGERDRFEDDSDKKRSLSSLALSKEVSTTLSRLVRFESRRGVVFGEWGFGGESVASVVLLYGPKGAGKRTICAGLATDLDTGRGLYRVNARDVVHCPDGFGSGTSHPSSDADGKTKRLDAVIDDCRLSDSILLLEGFEQALANSHSDTLADLTPTLSRALDRLSRFPGVVLLVADVEEPSTLRFSNDFLRRVSLALPIKPDSNMRAKIWRAIVPPTAPLSTDVDFDQLGQDFDLLPTSIRRAAISAAANANNNLVMHKHFYDAAKRELQRLRGLHADAIDRLFM